VLFYKVFKESPLAVPACWEASYFFLFLESLEA